MVRKMSNNKMDPAGAKVDFNAPAAPGSDVALYESAEFEAAVKAAAEPRVIAARSAADAAVEAAIEAAVKTAVERNPRAIALKAELADANAKTAELEAKKAKAKELNKLNGVMKGILVRHASTDEGKQRTRDLLSEEQKE